MSYSVVIYLYVRFSGLITAELLFLLLLVIMWFLFEEVSLYSGCL